MSTVFFNLVTLPYSTTNDVRVSLYKTSSPNAVVASQDKPSPHPQTTWSFPGLDRDNYIVRIFDVQTIPVQLGQDFTVIPDNNEVRYHDPVWIEFDVTANPDGGTFTSGTNTFTVPSWIGWNIIWDRKGADTQDGTDISWDKATGTALLQQPGDEFQPNEKWFLIFQPLVQASSSVTSGTFGRLWSSRLKVTNTTTLLSTDIAKRVVIKGAVSYFEITLPALSLVTEDVVTWFESGRGNHLCVKIKCNGSDTIDWLGSARNAIWIIPNETFQIYKEIDSGSRWRIDNGIPVYPHVGSFTSDYGGTIWNSIPVGSNTYSVKDYARLYWEYIRNLVSPDQVVSYASWSTGNNKYKFSLADDEVNGSFHVPDLRDLFERNSGDLYKAAFWEDWLMEDHFHFVPLGELLSPPFGSHDATTSNYGGYKDVLTVHADRTSQAKNVGTGSNAKIGFETRPTNFRAYKRILI